MKVLALYNNPCAISLFDWIEDQGNEVVRISDKLVVDWCEQQKFDFALSYTYRYILSQEILDALDHEVLNIHNSFLPFNRGADPNIWSIVDKTPRGVTIHFMDAKLDKGKIIAQKIVPLFDDDTLESSYQRLDQAAQSLFKEIYPYKEFWHEMCKQPEGKGTYHSVKQGKEIKQLVPDYSMPVKSLYEKAMRFLSMGGYRLKLYQNVA